MKYMVFVISILLIIIISLISKHLFSNSRIESISSFEFRYTTGNALNDDVLYKINCDNKCNMIIKPIGYSIYEINEIQISNEVLNKIVDVLNKYNVSRWHNFNKSDNRVLDGYSFSLSIKQKNGKSISASGYMRYPKNYKKVKNELEEIFNELNKN